MMAVKDITDAEVCQAVSDCREDGWKNWAYKLLSERTGQPEKVCYRAMERAAKRGLVDYGVSLRTGWLTDAGKKLIGELD